MKKPPSQVWETVLLLCGRLQALHNFWEHRTAFSRTNVSQEAFLRIYKQTFAWNGRAHPVSHPCNPLKREAQLNHGKGSPWGIGTLIAPVVS